jgi:hypothetical protein
MDDKQKAAYVAGFFDGEGHIGCHETARGHWTRQICAVNSDKALIDAVANMLRELGIPVRLYFSGADKKHWADRWVLYIAKGRSAFLRFRELIPIRSEDKRQALDRICDDSYVDPDEYALRRRTGEMSLCLQCERPFYASPAFHKRGGGKYCSRACTAAARRGVRVAHVCKTCGARFERPASATNARYCSMSCASKTKADRMRSLAKVAAQARWHNAKA